jgi:hypothetical protein
MRNLTTVIEEMLRVVPESESRLRGDLLNFKTVNLYKAPEEQTWEAVACTLRNNFELRSEPWIERLLRVWRDEEPERDPQQAFEEAREGAVAMLHEIHGIRSPFTSRTVERFVDTLIEAAVLKISLGQNAK